MPESEAFKQGFIPVTRDELAHSDQCSVCGVVVIDWELHRDWHVTSARIEAES